MEPKTAGRVSGVAPEVGGAWALAVARVEGQPSDDDSSLDPSARGGAAAQGLLVGTPVLTMDGELPVEHLGPSDRLITRDSGTAILRGLRPVAHRGTVIRVREGALGHRRPGADTDLLPGQKVLVRDWRDHALFGQPSAMVPAALLVDGQFVTRCDIRPALRAFSLVFDSPHVIYAGGLELGVELAAPRSGLRAAAPACLRHAGFAERTGSHRAGRSR
jgi:hypothetical protein